MATVSLEVDLRWIRKQRGEIAKDTARKLGISLQTLYAWERGRSKPNEVNRSLLLKWLIGKPVSNLNEEAAVKAWLENKERDAIEELGPEDWETNQLNRIPGIDQFLIELERPKGVSKREVISYIDSALRTECGFYPPEDPLFDFCHLRDTIKVMSRS